MNIYLLLRWTDPKRARFPEEYCVEKMLSNVPYIFKKLEKSCNLINKFEYFSQGLETVSAGLRDFSTGFIAAWTFLPFLDQQVLQLFVSIVCSPTWCLTWERVQSCHEPREKTSRDSWYAELLPCPAKLSPCLLYFNVCLLYLFFAYFYGLTNQKVKIYLIIVSRIV